MYIEETGRFINVRVEENVENILGHKKSTAIS